MKHYFSAKNNVEVNVGDTLIIKYKEKSSFGVRRIKEKILITEYNINDLVDAGFLNVTYDNDADIDMSVKYYIEKLAIKQGWDYDKMAGFINKLFEINKNSVFSMLLKEIAIEMDKKYNGHISDSEQIWSISTINGEPTKISKQHIASYNNFAAFRSQKDASIAWTILKPLILSMFTDAEEYKNIRIG